MVANVSMITFNVLGDTRGSLVALEEGCNLLFDVKRVYYIYGTQANIARGFHAHKKLKQMLISVSGSVEIHCNFIIKNIFRQKRRCILSENMILFKHQTNLILYIIMLKKIKNAYNMRLARKVSDLVLHGDKKILETIVEKISEEVIHAHYLREARQGKNYRVIISRQKNNEIELLFKNLSKSEKEEAERFYFEIFQNNPNNGPLNFSNLVLKYGTDDEIKKAISERGIPFSKIRDRGIAEEIKFYIASGKPYESRYIEDYLIDRSDKKEIENYLKNSNVSQIGDEFARLAMSMGYEMLVINKDISETIAKEIIANGNKELLLAYAPKISSNGIQLILERSVGFTRTEKRLLEEMRDRYQRKEDFLWAAEINR